MPPLPEAIITVLVPLFIDSYTRNIARDLVQAWGLLYDVARVSVSEAEAKACGS